MNWFSTVIRVAGVAFPGAASLVQLQSEIDSAKLTERVRRLEDPISALHADIDEISKKFYSIVVDTDYNKVKLSDDKYERYSRVLATLDKAGFIDCQHAIGRQKPLGLYLVDPSYIMYMCARFEDSKKMEALIQRLENCEIGHWLQGKKLAEELGLPKPVVAASFEIYEQKGYGIRSRECGAVAYCGSA